MNADYPGLVDALQSEPCGDFVVDGEVVAFDSRGVTSFSSLQRRARERVAIFYYLFDVLRLDGEDVRGLPLRERKAKLRRRARLRRPGPLQPAPQRARRGALPRRLPEGPRGHHRQARRQPLPRHPLERLAQAQVPRRAGARDRRLHRAAGVAHGLRRAAGRLLRGRPAALRRQGRHRVRPRHAAATLGTRMRELERDEPPFADVHPIPRGTHWIEPELVAQIAFTEWTRDGRLRHPRYLGLRDDKAAARRREGAARVTVDDLQPRQAAVPGRRAVARPTSPTTTKRSPSGCCPTSATGR